MRLDHLVRTLIADRYPILLAAIITIAASLLQADIGINLSDGGFLWYGTLRVLEGEVPLADFRSYDPGRYYWSALWTWFLGEGLIDLRRAVSIIQFIGLSAGLLVVSRVIHNRLMLALFGLLMAAWMLPQYKYFESSLTMLGVYVAVYLIEKPTLRRIFITGIFVGLSAFIGRNHGLYMVVGFMTTLIYIHLKISNMPFLNSIGTLAFGILIGYSPMIGMMIFIPGFFDGFWYSLYLLLINETTTIPVQTPWPWLVDFTSTAWLPAILQVFLGVTFLLFIVFVLTAWVYIWFTGSSKISNARILLIASAFIGAVYMHHGFSRADVGHAAGAIHPMLIGLIASIYLVIEKFKLSKVRQAVYQWICIGIIGILLLPPTFLGNEFFRLKLALEGKYVPFRIKDEQLLLRWWVADSLTTVSETMQTYVGDKEEYVLIAPNLPSLYPILGYKSPVWDIYMTLPNTPERQETMIDAMESKNVNWALISTAPPAAAESLTLEHAEPVLWSYLMAHFESIPIERLNSKSYLLLRRVVED